MILASSSFQPFGWAHLLMLTVTVVLGWWIVRESGKRWTGVRRERWSRVLSWMLIWPVVCDPVMVLLRYGIGEVGWETLVESALPFYLCDVVAIILVFALRWKSVFLTEIGYLWAVAGTTQGLLTPTLHFGPDSLEFWFFFAQHGAAPLAALLLIFGYGIRPAAGAFRRAIWWSLAYLGGVMLVNWVMGANYGFLNARPEIPTLLDHLGPWPWYLLSLLGLAAMLYLFLLAIIPGGVLYRFFSREGGSSL